MSDMHQQRSHSEATAEQGGLDVLRKNTKSEKVQEMEWTALRDRWEHSQITQAVLVTTALALLLSALAI